MIRKILVAALLCAATPASADVPDRWRSAWPDTDFALKSVDLTEIMSGGPPKDGIPAIDDPEFHGVAEETGLEAREAVVALSIGGEARAYPVRYLMWHEIVNDTVAGTPVSVTYCPLCNAAVVFDRRVGGETNSFGVSGMLRNSDMIMYDRLTESWWQQFTGEAVVGAMLGEELETVPASLTPWAVFSMENPEGTVMKRPEGYARRYGANPYVGYDSLRQPWLYDGDPPASGLPMMARVVRVQDRAWPLERVVEAGALTEAGVTLAWRGGMASALDAGSVAEGRDVGHVTVTDAASGDALSHEVTFAFVFQAFKPDGEWMMGAE